MGRRYEPADESETYDEYSRYQPARTKKSSDPGVSRYEVSRPSLKSLQAARKAKFMNVFANGMSQERPVRVSFSRKKFPRMDCLLEEIKRLNKQNVRFLFKWPSGEEVYDVGEIEEEEETNLYVFSKVKTLDKRQTYGGIKFGGSGAGNSAFLEKYSRNSHDSRRSDKPSPILRSQGSQGALRGGQITVNIISNTNRDCTQSLFIDPRSNQPFEEILRSITDMIVMTHPPCKALFSVKKPHKKVESISTLKRVIQTYGDTFWACGREGDPYEKLAGTPDESPTRNGPQRMKNGYKQNGTQQRDDRMRQSNGHSRQPDSQTDQYEDDDEEIEDYQPQQRHISPQRNNNKRNTKQNDNRQSQNRQSKRFEDENEDRRDNRKPRGAPNKGRDTEENSPREDDYRDKHREDSEERNDREQQNQERKRRGSSPPPHRGGNKQQDGDDMDDDNDEARDQASEEKMQKDIEAMERVDSDLDKDVHY